MSESLNQISEFHWLMNMIQSIDVGLLVVDREYNVVVWNSFMTNHSGTKADDVIGKRIFDTFPDVADSWFKRKVESVILLENRAFTTWEQRPYLFKFRSYRPITGAAEYMYQNITFLPLSSADTTINYVGIIIYDVTEVAVNKRELESANTELEKLSRTDRLTGLNNRGYWEECLKREFQRYKRTAQESTLVLFDIDHFKKVNDTYGHQAGDEVIRRTSGLLQETMRTTDIAGRYGGEEFGVILIDTTPDNALFFAERLRKCVETACIRYDGHTIAYTISLGLAKPNPSLQDYKQWLENSDQGLYEAKRSGRNRSIIFSDAGK